MQAFSFLSAILLFMLIQEAESQLYRVYRFNTQQKSAIVRAHNALRRDEYGANIQEMVWDENLANLAAGHARICDAWHRDAYQRKGYGYSYIGENIWWSTETWLRSNLKAFIKDFYDEKPFYHFDTQYCQPGEQCGHYTQVVWATSCAVGCAASYCNGIRNGRGINMGHIYVCNYGPGGNTPGQSPYIRGPPCSLCPGQCYNGLCQSQCSGTSYFDLQQPIPQIPNTLPVVPPPPPPPAPIIVQNDNIENELCADQSDECEYWASIGECQRNALYMNTNCKSSCAQCAFAAAGPPVDCTDKHLLCPFWQRTGECTANPSFMLRTCVGSCNPTSCSKKTMGVSDCQDEPGLECAAWSLIGECDRNPDYMIWKCRRSCGKC